MSTTKGGGSSFHAHSDPRKNKKIFLDRGFEFVPDLGDADKYSRDPVDSNEYEDIPDVVDVVDGPGEARLDDLSQQIQATKAKIIGNLALLPEYVVELLSLLPEEYRWYSSFHKNGPFCRS